MKRIAAALLPLLACAEAPQDTLPSQGTAYVHFPDGILPVSYVVEGDRVLVDDMAFPIDDFIAATIDPADLDDAIAGGHERAAIRAVGRRRWPKGVIPYRLGPGLTATQQTRIMGAIMHWEQNTPFRFINRTNETDYVTFTAGNNNGVCSSDVGRAGGAQNLEVDTCSQGNIIHEIGHLVGFFHEHQRGDRDDYITINWANVAAGQSTNFDTYVDQNRAGTDVGKYDYGSIMHWSAFAFSGNGQPTITPTQSGVTIGQRTGLSIADIDAAWRLVNPGGAYTELREFEVHIYSEPNQDGDEVAIGYGTFSADRGEFGVIGDNNISSLAVPRGMHVYAFAGGLVDPMMRYGTGRILALSPGMDNAISALAVSRALTVYDDINDINGAVQSFPIGEWKASAGQFDIIGDNTISAMYVPPGIIADLCTTDAGTTCVTVRLNEGNFYTSGLDNQTSMIRVKPAVTLYQEPLLAGGPRSKTLGIGTYTAADWAPVPDNGIKSLIVGDGLKATICTFPDGTGSCEVFRGDVSYVGETIDTFGASWIKIEPNTVP